MYSKYLIIGNGIAGLSAAKEIRLNDKVGEITMVTSESYLTYYRVKLTEALAEEIDENSLLVMKEKWYQDNKIDVLLNRKVKSINAEKNFIKLEDGEEISYEKLLIATGSRPFIPPIKGNEKNGVFALRTIDDVEQVQFYCIQCESFTVIGGGLLGLEAAFSLKELGKKVNVIEHSPYLLNRQLDEETGNRLKERLLSYGINVYTNSVTKEIVGNENVVGLIINDNEMIHTDGILISSGVRPNLDLIKETALKYDKGILVDKNLRTNLDNIFAAGDVIEIDGMVLGLWTAGNEQGKIAGANMSGKELEYTQPKLFTNLRIGDIQIFSAGTISKHDEIYVYNDDEKDIHHKIFVLEGKIMGVILYGDLKEMNTLRVAAMNHSSIEDYLKGGLSFKLQ